MARRGPKKAKPHRQPVGGLSLLVSDVAPNHAGLMAQLKLSPTEKGATTFWRFFPLSRYQRREVDAILRRLWDVGLDATRMIPGRLRTMSGSSLRRKDSLYRRIKPDANDREALEQLQAQGYRLTVDHAPGDLFNTTWMLAQGEITIKRWNRKPTLSEMEVQISLFMKRKRLEVAKPNPQATPDRLAYSSDMITLDWEIFPHGTVDEVVRFFSKGMKGTRGRDERILRERVEAFAALKPQAYIRV